MTDFFGQGTGALAGYFDHAVVGGNLVEEGEEAGGLWEDALGEVGFELEEGVVDAEAVVLNAALEEVGEFLLARQALANLEKLGGFGVDRVVEGDLTVIGGLFPTKSLFAEVGNFAVNVEIQALEVMELCDQLEDFGAKGLPDLKWRGTGVFVELADFVGGGLGILIDLDLDEFRAAGFEDAAVGEQRRTGWRSEGAGGEE